MSVDLFDALKTIRIDEGSWWFADLRIDIPPLSYGSDAANPHTQYSNAVAIKGDESAPGIGASFTLGEGNDLLCRAAEFIIRELDGTKVADLIESPQGIYETLANPRQLRWLSPYAGLPMMAAGLVMNTLIDAAAKRSGMPAWEYLSRLSTEDLVSLVSLKHIDSSLNRKTVVQQLNASMSGVNDRCEQLRHTGLPVYYTTWIGHSSEDISNQIKKQIEARGIRFFKIKISSELARDIQKLDEVRNAIPQDIKIAVDANQTLSFESAVSWLRALSSREVVWLEEPFAPDNTSLFAALSDLKLRENLTCEIATGENCPNTQTAIGLIANGLDRYQADPCRMMGLVDGLVTAISAHQYGRSYTPHAGGTGLDELAPHLQLLNLVRVDNTRDPLTSLTENVGFCSHFYAQPTRVTNGIAATPTEAGLLVGYNSNISQCLLNYREGISWLEL